MTKLDAYYGPLAGRFICEGVVSASPAAALQEAAERLESDTIKVTAAALVIMTPAHKQHMRDVAGNLGLRLREEARA